MKLYDCVQIISIKLKNLISYECLQTKLWLYANKNVQWKKLSALNDP